MAAISDKAASAGRQPAGWLATLSGADVAASDDLTGAQALGGDWELEVRTGYVETAVAFSTEVQQDWFGVLQNTAPYFGPTSFIPHTITTAADAAYSVTTADLDGDGDLDVLSASWLDDTIAWYENDGSQNFTAHTITTAADVAVSVTTADLDGDGDLDVLSASEDDDTIAWYENDGSENFTAHTISTAAEGAASVTTADLDGDGDLDVLSASWRDDTIAWYENDGSQNFTAQTITTAADAAVSITTADLDGDGDLDVLSASENDDTIAWYENDGSENFTAHTITTAADEPTSVTVADVDGDGDLDVLSASYIDDTIAWYENDGSQNFTAHIITTAADGAGSVTTADVDGDGDLDVFSASYDDDTIAWYENDGSQNFTPHTITTAADGAFSITTADVDGDGDLDVLSASELDDKIAWYENVGALNGMPTFVEGGPPVILDADVDVSDAEMDGFNAGNGNYDGASVTLVRNGGAASEDVFSFNDGNGITLVGGNLIKNSQIIASFDTTSTPGELVVSFTDANGEIPTSVDVDNILRQITYSNSSGTPPPSAPIDWTFDDGNTGAQGSGGALQAVGSTAVTIIRTLTSVTNAPSPNTAGDTSTHTVSFTTADPLPLDGKILVTFPAGFDLTAVGNADISSGTMDGSFSVSAAGQVLTITRSGGTAQPAAAENIIIADIINTSTAGAGYTVIVATQDSGSTPINGPTASSAFTIRGKLALANPDIQVTDRLGGTSGTQPSDVALVGFKLTPTGENTSWSDLVVSLAYGAGMADADITNARIYVDLGTVGTYDSGTDTQVGAQAVSAAAGALTWNTVGGTVAAATNYLIVFDTGAVLGNAETVQASVTAGNITGTGVTTSAPITAGGDVTNEPLHTVTVPPPNTAPYFGTTSFIPHDITTAADDAWSVTTADVDGDGDVDVLSASRLDDKIAWYENDGSENFTERVITTAADGANSVATADVDGDGDLDALSASTNDDTIAWYENDGSENFTAHTITTAADFATGVTVADVDGDGDLDVLSASHFDDKIAWYENDGSETFTERIITTTADGAWSVTTADVDGDGDLDVLSAADFDDTIAWYENDGNENFTSHTIINTAVNARSVTTADVDGDGDLDVLSASLGDDTVAWYENDGGENFTERTITTAADGAASVTVADVDGDGDLDVLSASSNDDTIAWYENDGSENFTARTITTAADYTTSVTTADVDGDGDLDVLSASFDDNKIAWYENDGSLNGAPTFVQGGPPVILDADVDVSDAELDAFNAGNGNYDGASLTLVRNGGATSEDVFSFNDGNSITLSGGNLIKNSQIIASFDTTSTPGELVVTFTDANGEIPTSVDVDNILRQITYSNSSGTPPPSAPIDWTFDDGNTGAQGSGGALQAVGSTTVTIIATLTGVSNAPSPNTVSDSSTHTVSFTTAAPLPLDGKIVITFPAGFDLTAVDDVDISSGTMDGSFTVSAAGQVLAITRFGGTAQPAAAESIVIADITNTSTAGAGYTVIVATQDSGSTPINGPTASSAFTIRGKLALANPDIQVTNRLGGASGTQPSDVALVGFKLTPIGENTSWSDLVVPLTYGGGMADADITNARIYVDLAAVGTYDSGVDTQVGAQAVSAAGGALTWNTVGGTVAAATNYLIVFDTGAVLGNGETVQASVTAGNITGTGVTTSASITTSGDVANEPLHTVTLDATPPNLTARTTRDIDGNGQIDRIELTFDENVDDSTANPADFTVKGYTVTGVVTGSGVDDNQLFLTLTERPSPDTGAKPDVRYTQGTLADLSANLLASDGGVTATDGAAPVLLSATSSVASTTLTVTFSEAVDTSNAGAGDLVIADFSYIDVSVSGAASVSSMGADADGTDNVVRITVNTAFTAGDNATDTIAAAAAGIYDLADLAAGPTAVALTISPDTTPPTIIARTTRDIDGNGQIDRIELTFDENVDDSTVNPTDFSVAGYTVTGITSGGVDDNQLFLTLTELASPDTGATPDVTYTQGTLADLSANLLASSWWDVLWLNRTKITFDNTASTEDLVDFPVLVSLTATEVNFADIEPLGADIRFVDHDGTPLDYEIEAWDDGAETATIWVRVQQIDLTSNTDFIWLYYNKPGEVDGQNAAGVWDANYGGVWHLEETVADELIGGNHDDSAGANNGTQNNNEGVPGKIAGAQDFDGTGDYIDLGNSATLMPSSVTTCAWAKREGPGDGNNFQDIVGKTEWDVGGYLLFLSDEATDVEWRITDVLFIRAIKSSVTTTSEWHFYCGTFSGSTSRLYVDGVLTNSSSTASMGTTTRSAAIGDGWAVDGNSQFDGLIDEVRISNAARSAEWIEASYLSQNGTFNTFSGAQVATIDGAAPVIVGATSSLGWTTLTVTFSEGVDTSNGGAGDLVTGDFSYIDVSTGGAGSVSSMGADADGTDNVVTLTVNAPFNAGDNATDTLAAASTAIYDLVDIPAGTATVTVTIIPLIATIVSAADQSFGVNNLATAIQTITVTDSGTPVITAANDIRIRIPAGFNMEWDTADTAATIGGSASGKVSTTVSYDSNLILVLDVTADFAASETITISDLSFTNFTAPSSPGYLELEVDNAGGTEDTDARFIHISSAVLSSAANQSFQTGDAATAATVITITEDLDITTMRRRQDLRIRIPAAFPMKWNESVTSVTIGGGAAAKVSTTLKRYEDAGRTAVIDITTSFAATDQITVTGLQFLDFARPAAADNLELQVFRNGYIADEDDKTKEITLGPNPTLLSDVDQVFAAGDPATLAATITITDTAASAITKKNRIWITIPNSLNMVWDNSITNITVGGTGASHLKDPAVRGYLDNDKTVEIDVDEDFLGGESLTLEGLQFLNFTGVSAADSLTMSLDKGGSVADTDDNTKAIGGIVLSSASNQAFTIGVTPAAADVITVTDQVGNSSITAANDIRITIPSVLPMIWDTTVTSVTLGGNAAAKVSTTLLRYEDNDRTLVLDVTNDFNGGEQVTISGAFFADFFASAVESLTAEVRNDGQTSAVDDKTITISGANNTVVSSEADQFFIPSGPNRVAETITIVHSSTTQEIDKKMELRLKIPVAFNMTWDPAVATITTGAPRRRSSRSTSRATRTATRRSFSMSARTSLSESSSRSMTSLLRLSARRALPTISSSTSMPAP